jgi:hypothetical protein
MTEENDGGYYAIKGFLYQFDKTLIEIIMNPDLKIGIEQRQDIDYQDFVIQVKHKETQDYKDSKIKKPVIQLIDMFKEDQTQKFCLYCYFKDKEPSKWILTLADLNKILGNKANDYTQFIKEKFINSSFIHFSENFEDQFILLIDLIKSNFSLIDDDLAYFYHSLLRSRLLDISIKLKGKREISRQNLDEFINDAEKTVFYTAYSKYLDEAKYERLVKKKFFTFRNANVENFERLFIIEYDNKAITVELSKVVNSLISKYFKVSKSPQPYLCFINIDEQKLIDLKQDLIDQGIFFDDGTYFNGDRFRLERIIESNLEFNNPRIKIINRGYLERVLSKMKFQEIYQFYLTSPSKLETVCSHIKIQITETKQILRML